MHRIDIAGLKVDAISKKELIDSLQTRISQGQKTFITTLYSEFLYAAIKDRKVLDMLNQADIAVADGIGIMWAARYLSIKLTAKNFWLKILQAMWQAKYSLAAVIFRPGWIKTIPSCVIPSESDEPRNPLTDADTTVKGSLRSRSDALTLGRDDTKIKTKTQWEKIVGADLIWDLAELAAKNNYSIYLLGGHGDTPKIVAEKLKIKNSKLKISGFSPKNPGDPTIADDVKKAAPDLLFVAYGPIKQEAWIAQNLPNLPVKLAIGLGGTFDYLAGKRLNPPRFLRYSGLEWLFRLLTQPRRIKRIFTATFGLVWVLIKYKVFSNLSFRQNVVSVIINHDNKILIARFNPNHPAAKFVGYSPKSLGNYWQFSQGGIDKGEDIITAARRETEEELGLRDLDLIKISDKTYSYRWPINHKLFIAPRWRHKGQEQHIVYFKFNGTDNKIKLDNYEFLEYKWVSLEDLENSVHDEKKPLAKIIQYDLKNQA